jgi:hypothetical protein
MSSSAISCDEAKSLGVWTEHQRMPNGELRFRLRNEDGSAYIRTQSTSEGGWQKSHYHVSVRETYIVQVGQIALAESVADRVIIRVFRAGQMFTTEPMVPHNIFMFRESIIHTVKHGSDGQVSDWHPVPSLDQRTAHLSETEILRFVGPVTGKGIDP